MTYLPAKRKKQPLGVRIPEKKESARHRKFVRGHECILKGRKDHICNSPIRFCHVRAGLPEGEQAGVSQKPHDCFGYPGCDSAHDEQHQIGESSFERKYGVQLLATAIALASQSTDPEIRLKVRSIQR